MVVAIIRGNLRLEEEDCNRLVGTDPTSNMTVVPQRPTVILGEKLKTKVDQRSIKSQGPDYDQSLPD